MTRLDSARITRTKGQELLLSVRLANPQPKDTPLQNLGREKGPSLQALKKPAGLTLDPDKAIQEVEMAPVVWPGSPIRPPDLVGLLCEAGILTDLVHDVGREAAILVGLEDHTFGRKGEKGGDRSASTLARPQRRSAVDLGRGIQPTGHLL